MEEKTEIWKDIPEYEGLYQVSNWGQVKSLNKYVNSVYGSKQLRKERILKPIKNEFGYLLVGLSKDGRGKRFRIHRLVALAFIPNPENLPCINHKDENKENNRVENLEWVTVKQNNNYGTARKRQSETIKGKPRYKHRKPILQYTKDMVFIREWDSAKSAIRELKINKANITACCKGKRKSAGGFVWRYK